MVRLNFLVEGETEETFVRDLLTPHFSQLEIYCTARRVETKRANGKIYRGGITNYEKVKKDLLRWMKEDTNAHFTSMFDLYALPSDFPKYNESLGIRDPYKKVQFLEQSFFEDIEYRRFTPYIQLHEFEALLFSDVNIIEQRLKPFQPRTKLEDLNKILFECHSPELIDDGIQTAPSKRLLVLYPAYQKRLYGSLISKEIGLATIQSKCPHFHWWITTLQGLK
ncbi:MAG: DUF4276 family protein [Chloroherpetonaceae bacterium]|nr:DUF4276 family protein [Chloroherpetonaceae bacterium]